MPDELRAHERHVLSRDFAAGAVDTVRKRFRSSRLADTFHQVRSGSFTQAEYMNVGDLESGVTLVHQVTDGRANPSWVRYTAPAPSPALPIVRKSIWDARDAMFF